MKEEQAVLDFFAKPENLPLGLSVAELVNDIRIRMNSNFWQELQQRLNAFFAANTPAFKLDVIEDRNSSDLLVGLQARLREPQEIYLFPVIEQQYLGGNWRVFMGLMWLSTPTAGQLALPAVASLKTRLADAGYKNNENFLAWQWTGLHPQRRDFLMRYSSQPESLLDEAMSEFNALHHACREQIAAANAALKSSPRAMTVSLDQLRRKRED